MVEYEEVLQYGNIRFIDEIPKYHMQRGLSIKIVVIKY